MGADPIAFLMAALARAEETAKAVGTVSWGAASTTGPGGWAEYIAFRHLMGPDALLRRVAADRQIIAEHAEVDGCCRICADGKDVDLLDYGGWGSLVEAVPLPWPCRTVRLLAQAWGWTEETT